MAFPSLRSMFAGLSVLAVLSLPPSANAIPAFSRLYGTSCTTCHSDFPKLNDFGKAFKDAGFKFPKDDESFLKTPPVLLGAPAQAELWPHTVYPGSIPGHLPVGLRYNTYYQQVSCKPEQLQSGSSRGHDRHLHSQVRFSAWILQHLHSGQLRHRHFLLGG